MPRFLRWLFLLLGSLSACSPRLPEERLLPFDCNIVQRLEGDSVWLEMPNPIAAPLRVYLSSEVPELQAQLYSPKRGK